AWASSFVGRFIKNLSAQIAQAAELRIEQPAIRVHDHAVGQTGEPVADLAGFAGFGGLGVDEARDARRQDVDHAVALIDVVRPARIPQREHHLPRLVFHLLDLRALEDDVVRHFFEERYHALGGRRYDQLEAIAIRARRHEILPLAQTAAFDA